MGKLCNFKWNKGMQNQLNSMHHLNMEQLEQKFKLCKVDLKI